MVRRSLTVVVVLGLLTAGWATVATAAPADEASMVSLINGERSANGLTTLCTHADLTAFGRNHTADMIAEGSIFHSSNLGSAASGWSAMGENVGMGPNVSILHEAFMNSSGHRANILGDYTHIGVGIDVAPSGTMFVTVVFMKAAPCGATTTTTTAPPTTTTTSPPATTTTTAPAPTTTTTAAPAPTTTTTAAPTTTTTAPSLAVPVDRTPSSQLRPTIAAGTQPVACGSIAYEFLDSGVNCVD